MGMGEIGLLTELSAETEGTAMGKWRPEGGAMVGTMSLMILFIRGTLII